MKRPINNFECEKTKNENTFFKCDLLERMDDFLLQYISLLKMLRVKLNCDGARLQKATNIDNKILVTFQQYNLRLFGHNTASLTVN